ncbi:unnamed protein product [marine sediment metagenome]|uniref:HTH luxR-type domain-containing protein n=1 Tax=marine sediment metagenome TaxID=412755 RepID=X1QFV3_9ZZZZ
MPRLSRKQTKETIEAYLAQHPNATSSEIGKALGVSKQRAHQLLTLVRGADTPLKDHELKILRYMAMGNTNKEIGEALNLDEQTIKNQVTLILAKLNASNRAHAAALAMQRGIISLSKLEVAKTALK